MELVQPPDNATEAQIWERVTGDYVILDIVEKAADRLVRIREEQGAFGLADSIFTRDDFTKTYGNKLLPAVCLRELDMQVLVKFLERERMLIVVDKEA